MEAAEKDNRGVIALALGIIGLMMCAFLAPVAWYMGAAARRADVEEGRDPDSMATVGMVLGIAGTLVMVLQMLFVGVYCVFMGGFALLMAFAGVAGNM